MTTIVVCVKHVPDATADRHFEADNTVDRVGVDGLLSELDEYAVEQALRLKEKADNPDDVTVTAVTIGPEKAVDAVRKALQMGADQGVHVVGRRDRRLRCHRDLAGARRGGQEGRRGRRTRPGDVRHVVDRRHRWAWSRRCSPSVSASRR